MLLLCGTIFVIFASASMSVFTSFVNNVTSVISDEGNFVHLHGVWAPL